MRGSPTFVGRYYVSDAHPLRNGLSKMIMEDNRRYVLADVIHRMIEENKRMKQRILYLESKLR